VQKKTSTFWQLSDIHGFVDGKGQRESYTQKVEGSMSKNSKHQPKKQYKIHGVEPTDEKITGRGGLSLFVKYLDLN
jgi:hypothetical protein